MNPTRTLRTVLPFALAAATVLAQEPPERPLTLRDASEGKAIYIRECSGCHGERGLGDGPASKHIDPLPRDFTARKFKLRTTASGEPPATADVVRVIERGIPGTAMPAFSYLTETVGARAVRHVAQGHAGEEALPRRPHRRRPRRRREVLLPRLPHPGRRQGGRGRPRPPPLGGEAPSRRGAQVPAPGPDPEASSRVLCWDGSSIPGRASIIGPDDFVAFAGTYGGHAAVGRFD